MKARDIVKLSDNNEYMIISKINYKNKQYLYLIDINNKKNINFFNVNGEILNPIEDKTLLTELLPIFLKNTIDNFEK